MPSKLGNVLPLFINVKKCVGSLFTSHLLNDLTEGKVKDVCLTELILHLKRFYSSHSKNTIVKIKVAIIVAINLLLKLLVPSIQHFQLNRECSFNELFAYFFSLH